MVMKPVQLLTGRPGTGKTSLIRQVTAGYNGKAGGFFTGEIRERGLRLGFRLVTLGGQEVILAHVDFDKRFHVGKYGVNVAALDETGVPALHRAAATCDLVIIDEIGRMELFSAAFRSAVETIVGGGKRVLGTIILSPDPFADAIKNHPNVDVITLTRENYESVLAGRRAWLEAGRI
jgi:nucleoside-triphosphatase